MFQYVPKTQKNLTNNIEQKNQRKNLVKTHLSSSHIQLTPQKNQPVPMSPP